MRSTYPSTLTLVLRTRVGSTSTRPTVRQLPATEPRVTGAVRRPISCCRMGSIVTVASPSTCGPPVAGVGVPPGADWSGFTSTSFIPQIGQSPG